MNNKKLQQLVKMFEAGQFERMEDDLRTYLIKHKNDGMAWKALGACLKRQGKECLEEMHKACELIPKDHEVWFNLGVEQHAKGDNEASINSYKRALMLNPNSAKVYNNLGNTLRATGQQHEALQCYYRAMQLDPNMVEAVMNVGCDLLGIGKYSKACDYFERALEMKPDFIEAHSNLIFALDLMTTENTESQQNARKAFNDSFMANVPMRSKHDNVRNPNRKLRIGYVSGDFREHSAARVFGSMIDCHDRENFEVFCYDNKMQPDDSYTARFKQNANWRIIQHLSDEQVEDLIVADGIDILVDLSGHSAQNRLFVFARKPAPIQITAWGYATGTGMKAIDYFFADKIVIPENERIHYAEQIVDLPCVATSHFTEPFPDICELPYKTNGHITFGCLNRLHKVTDECFATWAEIMDKVPGSKFILKAGELNDEQSRQNAMWQFVRAGISPDRIILMGATPWIQHVSAYNLIDIALDPFPHGGGVTAMEGMAMGVPAVVLKWPTLVGRLSASLFSAVGMDRWIADNANAYIKLAIEKAGSIDEIDTARKELRKKFLDSYLGNHEKYARKVEETYRNLWIDYCK